MSGKGSAVAGADSGHGLIEQSFSVGDHLLCEYFEDGSYEGCEQSTFEIKYRENRVNLSISNSRLNANHEEETGAEIELHRLTIDDLREILECVYSYFDTGEEINRDTGYIQGTFTDEEGPRTVNILTVGVSDSGVDFGGVDENGTAIEDQVRIPTRVDYREGEADLSVNLERFCSICSVHWRGQWYRRYIRIKWILSGSSKTFR